MFRKLFAGKERRKYPRQEAAIELDIELELYGFAGRSEPVFTRGRTVNISRGGLLAEFDAPVESGTVCNLYFREGSERVSPRRVSGRVMRCSPGEGTFRVAVEFDAPLETLNAPELARVSVRL